MVAQQEKALALGILADLLQLGVGGELHLVVSGYADVGRGIAGQGSGGHGLSSSLN